METEKAFNDGVQLLKRLLEVRDPILGMFNEWDDQVDDSDSAVEKLFKSLRKYSEKHLSFFDYCTLDVYRATYEERLKEFRNEYSDSNNQDFISAEIKRISHLSTIIIDGHSPKKLEYSVREITNFLHEKSIGEDMSHMSGKVKWTGNKAELMELTKALIEAGVIEGTQKDLVSLIESAFNFPIKDFDKSLRNMIVGRNHQRETKFLDKLKDAFYAYTKKIS